MTREPSFPDQELFEPVELEREKNRPLVWRVLRWGGALIAVLGLLYLSGVYQLGLFQQTSETFIREPLPQKASGTLLTVPVEVVVLGAIDAENVRWNNDRIERLLKNTSAIWQQGGILFEVELVRRMRVDRDTVQGFIRNPERIVENVERTSDEEHTNTLITVVLIETLQGLNGIAYQGSDLVAVADYTTSFNDRVLAHEFGHIFGLGHIVGDPGRLMAQGSEGVVLTKEEIAIARATRSGG